MHPPLIVFPVRVIHEIGAVELNSLLQLHLDSPVEGFIFVHLFGTSPGTPRKPFLFAKLVLDHDTCCVQMNVFETHNAED